MGDEACRGAWHFARVFGSLITDSAAGEPRVTIDVDALAEILSYAQYAAFGERLRSLGFSEDTTPGAPVCRWVQQSVILDVMPLDEKIIGFSNRWYRASMKAAVVHRISADLDIRVVSAPYFLATKLKAIRGRGQGDLFASTHSNGKAITIPSHADHCLVGRYFAALDLERQMTVLHEVMDARTAGQSLDKVVELQEHAGLLEVLILGV